MPLGLLVALVFVVTVVGVVGVFYLMAGRSQEAILRRSVGDRLQEVATGGKLAEGAESLLRTQLQGPLPAVDKVARHALKGLAIERWVEQSGMKVSLGGLFLISLLLGAVAAIAATTASHISWAGARTPARVAHGLARLPRERL